MTRDQRDTEQEALHTAESILALLHYRGIVDSALNREDVAAALTAVRNALGRPGTYTARPIPDPPPTWRERFRGKR